MLPGARDNANRAAGRVPRSFCNVITNFSRVSRRSGKVITHSSTYDKSIVLG